MAKSDTKKEVLRMNANEATKLIEASRTIANVLKEMSDVDRAKTLQSVMALFSMYASEDGCVYTRSE